MKAYLFVLFILLFQISTYASSHDLELIQRDAVSDFKIQHQLKLKDARKLSRLKTFASVFEVNAASGQSCEQKCQDLCAGNGGGGGSGSGACWSQCTKEGYSSSTCASRCGVSNSTGSEACWQACSNEGYSSSTWPAVVILTPVVAALRVGIVVGKKGTRVQHVLHAAESTLQRAVALAGLNVRKRVIRVQRAQAVAELIS